jgi:hypothetical protein
VPAREDISPVIIMPYYSDYRYLFPIAGLQRQGCWNRFIVMVLVDCSLSRKVANPGATYRNEVVRAASLYLLAFGELQG